MEASVRYINPPTSGDLDDGGFKPAVCFRAREYAHCVVNEDAGIHVVKVPIRDFDHAPVVQLRGAVYPVERAAKTMLAFTKREVARREITQAAADLLARVLDGSVTAESVELPPAPAAAPSSKPKSVENRPAAAPTTLVATICAELAIDPPVARRLLRKAGLSAPYTDEAKIRSILTKK